MLARTSSVLALLALSGLAPAQENAGKFHVPGAQAGDQAGNALAAHGNALLVGAPGRGEQNGSPGSPATKEAFLLDAVTGQSLQTFVVADAQVGDWFGTSVALDDTYAVVGAYKYEGVGRAHLFSRQTGQEVLRFTEPVPGVPNYFGFAVAVGEGYVAISAPQVDQGKGRVYVFDAATGGLVHELEPSPHMGWFGSSLAIDQGRLAIGKLDDRHARIVPLAFDDFWCAAFHQKLAAILLRSGRAMLGIIFVFYRVKNLHLCDQIDRHGTSPQLCKCCFRKA